MNIIYHFPFPDEVCDKIFHYTCKSPHTGLCVGRLKNYLKMKYLSIPDKDEEVTEIDISIIGLYTREHESIFPYEKLTHISIYCCFTNLIKLSFYHSNIIGDLYELNPLKNLEIIYFNNLLINGDIIHLKSLTKLTHISISNMNITGDIVHLKSLQNLISIVFKNVPVYGDIKHLEFLKKFYNENTRIINYTLGSMSTNGYYI